jgi:hypothetical protein
MHAWIVPLLVLLLASPLLLLGAMACAGWPKWRETSLLFMVGSVLLAQNTMLSMMTTYRFLQPLTIITLLAAESLWNTFAGASRGKRTMRDELRWSQRFLERKVAIDEKTSPRGSPPVQLPNTFLVNKRSA